MLLSTIFLKKTVEYDDGTLDDFLQIIISEQKFILRPIFRK